jgi:hypothetical protein
MADQIIQVLPVDPRTLELQTYTLQDESLINSSLIDGRFGESNDYVEYFVFSLQKDLLYPVDTPAISFTDFTVTDDPNLQNKGYYSTINIDPVVDAAEYGFDVGEFITVYNFLKTRLSSSIDNNFFISEISSDRTEIRLDSNTIPDVIFIPLARELEAEIKASVEFYKDFYLDFGSNQLVIANNITTDLSNPTNPTILIKLYEALPNQFQVKSTCWVVEQAAESVAYQISISQVFNLPDDFIQISGPNTNLNIKGEINNSTDYVNFSSLTQTSVSGAFNQLDSLLEEKGVEINVDYSSYNNFIYLSSAYQRLSNFQYKLGLLEEYQTSQSIASSITGSATGSIAYSSSLAILGYQINDIIRNFDGYEYYLYYESASTAWPKQNGNPPYILYSTTSSEGVTWFNSQSIVAQEYDKNNVNNLFYVIPEFVRDDSLNEPYVLFTNMVGQSFDNTWLYVKDLENRYDNDNRINFGISKDLVADALRSFGIKLYQNNFSSDDLYIALLGYNPEGGYLPPTGSELITNYVTSSAEPIPLEDVNYRTYKRLYNALPLLLKKKGTVDGLKALITVYGIPDTILRVSEFGGKDKINENDWDFWQQKFNYAYNSIVDTDYIGTEFVLNSSWNTSYTDNRPETVAFRFKTPNVQSAQFSRSQSLFITDQGSFLSLEYSGSVNSSGSYSGSSINPYNEYAYLTFYPDYNASPNTSASLYLPFFDGGWWAAAVTVDDNAGNFTLYAANNIYNGDDGSQIGFIASQSVNGALNIWDTSISASFSSNLGSAFGNYGLFSGSLQEIRYYTKAIALSSFEDFTMNPDSIEATIWDGAPLELAFRASLGGELYTSSVSIHPKVTGSWEATSSFANNSNFYIGNTSNFVANYETIYFDQPVAGIRNIVSNKIHPISASLPAGDTLSRYIQIQQNSEEENNYTNNISYVEVGFSPQNEINEDIMDQMGFFNIGEFIGDPRQRFNKLDTYPDLDKLANSYFEKYIGNYNFTDYIRLIKYFDNSLFKMLQDFIPARTSLASGVIIKQNLLERSKYPQPSVTSSLFDYTGSIEMVFVTGGAGGSVNQYNGLTNNFGVTQSWTESLITPFGVDYVINSSQEEFYNGEFSGSYINTDNGGELNLPNTFKQVNTTPTNYNVNLYGGDGAGSTPTSSATFISSVVPTPGVAAIWSQNPTPSGIPERFPPYIQYAKIHSLDLASENNGLTLASVESIVWAGFTFYPITISPRDGGDYYFFEFAPGNSAQYLLSDPTPYSNQLLVLSPKVSDATGPFQNNDYNAIINNAIENRLNSKIQEVDYATSQNIPVNIQAILSGSAYPASVPDSNYTSLWWNEPRYLGSKNTTDNLNSTSLTQSFVVQDYQNDDIGATTLGQPSIDLFNTNIYEFAWGGGTYPQIATGGALKLSQILNVNTTSSVATISPQDIFFSFSVQSNLPPNSQPQITQRTTTANIPNTARVLSSEFGVPTISNYYIPSGSTTLGGAATTGSFTTLSLFGGFLTNLIPEPGIDNNGFESAVAAVTGSTPATITSTISASLSAGERWFVSMYYNLGTTASGSLTPVNNGYDTINGDGSYAYPLEYNGVYEIDRVSATHSNVLILTKAVNVSLEMGANASPLATGYAAAGCLIWKAITDGTFVTFNGTTLSGVGKGNLITPNASPTIKSDLNSIVTTSGI